MTFSMSQVSLPSFEISLNALSAISTKPLIMRLPKIDPAVLLSDASVADRGGFAENRLLLCGEVGRRAARLAL